MPIAGGIAASAGSDDEGMRMLGVDPVFSGGSDR